jgi:hypothetical protein
MKFWQTSVLLKIHERQRRSACAGSDASGLNRRYPQRGPLALDVFAHRSNLGVLEA